MLVKFFRNPDQKDINAFLYEEDKRAEYFRVHFVKQTIEDETLIISIWYSV